MRVLSLSLALLFIIFAAAGFIMAQFSPVQTHRTLIGSSALLACGIAAIAVALFA